MILSDMWTELLIFAACVALFYFYATYDGPVAYSLEGTSAVVTGASSGLGPVIAGRLAKEGVKNIALVARRKNQLDEQAEQLGSQYPGTRFLVVPGSLTDAQDRQRVFDEVVKEFGKCEILVNNAGIENTGRFSDKTSEDVFDEMDINVRALISLTQLFLPHMMSNGRGHVVNVASLAGFTSIPSLVMYSVSKHAVVGFSKSLRGEHTAYGIPVTVHHVSPGMVLDTGMAKDELTAAGQDFPKMLGGVTGMDVANAVVKVIVHNKPGEIVNGKNPPGYLVASLALLLPRHVDFLYRPGVLRMLGLAKTLGVDDK